MPLAQLLEQHQLGVYILPIIHAVIFGAPVVLCHWRLGTRGVIWGVVLSALLALWVANGAHEQLHLPGRHSMPVESLVLGVVWALLIVIKRSLGSPVAGEPPQRAGTAGN